MQISTKKEVTVTLTLNEDEANYIRYMCENPKTCENEEAKKIRESLYDLINQNDDISNHDVWTYRTTPVAAAPIKADESRPRPPRPRKRNGAKL